MATIGSTDAARRAGARLGEDRGEDRNRGAGDVGQRLDGADG